MHTAYLNIGSNIGDRRGNIAAAVAAIKERLDAGAAVSAEVESEPWGYSSPNPYINIGVALRTELSPLDLLGAVRDIERAISPAPHRNADGSYADRLIDIDIIAVDSLVVDVAELQIPHPRMHERRFVLEPMNCLNPRWIHPILGLNPSQMLENILLDFML